MKLYIKQHIFTFGTKFSVYDEEENEVFFVESEIFTLGKSLHIYTPDGNEVSHILQELFTLTPKYTVSIADEYAFEIVKSFTFFLPSYEINGMGLSVDGDFSCHEYEVYREGRAVAYISKEWFTIGDCYCLEYLDTPSQKETLAVLCAAIVIDCVNASRK